MRRAAKILRGAFILVAIVGLPLALSGCGGNVGVGLNVGVPIGNHGYMSVGTNRWY